MDLFDTSYRETIKKIAPLADRMRPESFEEFKEEKVPQGLNPNSTFLVNLECLELAEGQNSNVRISVTSNQ